MLLCASQKCRNCVDLHHARRPLPSGKAWLRPILVAYGKDLQQKRPLQERRLHAYSTEKSDFLSYSKRSLPGRPQNAFPCPHGVSRSMAFHVDVCTIDQETCNYSDREGTHTDVSMHRPSDQGTSTNMSGGSGSHRDNTEYDAIAGKHGLAEDGSTFFCHDSNLHLPWNRQISYNVQRQQIRQAVFAFSRMLQESIIPDKSTYILLLSMRCSSLIVLRLILQVHSLLPNLKIDKQSNVILQNILISIYGRFNLLEFSRIIFCDLPERTVVSWNAIISVYVQQGQPQAALLVFHQMMQEGMMGNLITFVSTLHACSSKSALQIGMRLHAGIAGLDSVKDVRLNTALVSMYAKCDCMAQAEKLFEKMPERSVISWNTMISAYARHGQGKHVVELFHELQKVSFMPTVVTFIGIISTLLDSSDLEKGKQVHALVMGELFDSNTSIGTALISMYRRCGSISNALRAFDAMRKLDEGPWSAMIATYVQYSKPSEALQLFLHMQVQGVWPSKATYSGILSACSIKTALFNGMQLHAVITSTSSQKDVLVNNALISMYAKCGSLDKAHGVFDKMDERNTASWNAMLDAHALHGKADDVFQFYARMQLDQVPPDNLTFTSMLTLCSRLGLVDEAHSFLLSMSKEFGLAPSRDHFNCFADLLARSGKLEYAEALLSNMPVSHCAVSMRTLLGGCRTLTDVNRAERAARQVILLDPKSTSPYMILRNLYGVVDEKHAP